MIEADLLPVHRTYELSREEALIRQLVLQLKLGRVSFDYFATEFSVELDALFKVQLETLKNQKLIKIENRSIVVENKGLLKVDEWLKTFYLPQHQSTNTHQDATEAL
jgi:coproporphyrinogen III oxidase-like Fe-S oxidoreductase